MRHKYIYLCSARCNVCSTQKCMGFCKIETIAISGGDILHVAIKRNNRVSERGMIIYSAHEMILKKPNRR